MAQATEKVKRLRKAAVRANDPNTLVNQTKASVINPQDKADAKSIINQIENEYTLAWRETLPKIQEGLSRLKLYNNQKRDKDRVGDPMLFTVHQTVLSMLQDDRLGVEFGGRTEEGEENAENLNGLAEYDYDEMDKFWLDYEWNWDTLAWGRGLLYFNDFDPKTKTPLAEVWDPLTFIRDPLATSVNGNRLGHGAMRFGGREVRLTKGQMESNPEYFNLDKLKKTGSANALSITFQATQARKQAQGLANLANWEGTLEDNYEYPILQWLTMLNGDKYIVELANDRKLVVRMTEILDCEDQPAKDWPIIDRPCFPMSHDWDGVSVFDIIEDKQRFRAAMINIYGDTAKADLYPMYVFDSNKIKKTTDKNFGFNKFIPSDGPVGQDTIHPLQKAAPNQQMAQFILNFLDMSAQRALATPEIQQGAAQQGDQTLGELNLANQGVDKRYSLTARLFGRSEMKYWKRWYDIYYRDFQEGIHTKVIRLMGVEHPEWLEVVRDKIIQGDLLGPIIKIESRHVSEAKKLRAYTQMKDYFSMLLIDPVMQSTDRPYAYRRLGKNIMSRKEIERIIPLTVDERRAKEENDKLSKNVPVKVQLEDDHNIHLRMHAAAKDTKAAENHIKAHEDALMIKKVIPQVFPQEPGQQPMGQPGQPMPGQPGQPPLAPPAPEGAGGLMTNG